MEREREVQTAEQLGVPALELAEPLGERSVGRHVDVMTVLQQRAHHVEGVLGREGLPRSAQTEVAPHYSRNRAEQSVRRSEPGTP